MFAFDDKTIPTQSKPIKEANKRTSTPSAKPRKDISPPVAIVENIMGIIVAKAVSEIKSKKVAIPPRTKGIFLKTKIIIIKVSDHPQCLNKKIIDRVKTKRVSAVQASIAINCLQRFKY